MNALKNTLMAAAIGSALGLASVNATAGGRVAPQRYIDEQTQADLQFMREEEKLARDVYLELADTWNLAVFENIAQSEQRHMDSVENLVDKYGIDDPVLNESERGNFVNPDLQALYEQLLLDGSDSATDALFVGALIEEVDINDLQSAIETTSAPDVLRVYENLLRGSRNHLRAFVAKLELEGIVYEAQVLSQEEVDEILNTPTERGSPRRRNGNKR